MNKIREFNKKNAEDFRQQILTVLNKLAAENGLSLTMGRTTFKRQEFHTSIRANPSVDGILYDAHHFDYIEYCQRFNLKREWLGKSFVYQGVKATIIGLKHRSLRNPVLVETEEGRFKESAYLVRDAMTLQEEQDERDRKEQAKQKREERKKIKAEG